MKIIITGSTGHISKPLTSQLVKAGHTVTVISSSKDKDLEITDLGAQPAIGSVEDASFLTEIFKGADAVYTMIPPKLDAENWKSFIFKIADNYVEAIKANAVKKVVHLSSVGADVPEGGGLVSIYYGVEQKLHTLSNISITFLRPASFYTNFFGNIGMIKQFNMIGNNYGDLLLPMVDPSDIAEAAFQELTAITDNGKKSVRYVVSDERLTSEIAAVLGEAIGKPGLPWVKLKDEDIFNGMVKNGITADVANNLMEMGRAVERGETRSGYLKNKPEFGRVKLEDFAAAFAQVYLRS